MIQRTYSLHKSRKILRSYYALLKRKTHLLSAHQAEILTHDLKNLDQAVIHSNRTEASNLAKKVVVFCKEQGLRNHWDTYREVIWALVFAIVVAFIIRQLWFELYEVPTGSMRPTIQELDRLAVSKTTFGIHLPFSKSLLFYKPERIQRGGIIVLSTDGMPIANNRMLYFGLLPGKKRYVKRCVNRPGDTLYFYGGYIYTIDKEGQAIVSLADPAYLERYHLEKIDHVPFMNYGGEVDVSEQIQEGVYRTTVIKQMNLPVARLHVTPQGLIEGQFFNGHEWVTDRPNALKEPHNEPVSYSDLWGIGNFAMARLLTPEETKKFYGFTADKDVELVLELQHTPNLTFPTPIVRRGTQGRMYPMLSPYVALLPLKTPQLNTLQQSLITSRFCVKNGRAFAYHKGRRRPQPLEFDIPLPQIHDGCYEFYYGKAYRIEIAGLRHLLPKTHPLYDLNPSLLQALFNTGVSWNRLYEAMAPYQAYHPHRYAYFRDGDLFLMGAPFLKKEDPLLQRFITEELQKQKLSSVTRPYIAFRDMGPPLLADGSLDIEKITRFGLHVPEGYVIGLGDNYAMSADSRDFGFIPVENLRGAPSFNFWPPSTRLGPLAQPPYPWITAPNLLVWSSAGCIIVGCWLFHRKKNKTSVFKK